MSSCYATTSSLGLVNLLRRLKLLQSPFPPIWTAPNLIPPCLTMSMTDRVGNSLTKFATALLHNGGLQHLSMVCCRLSACEPVLGPPLVRLGHQRRPPGTLLPGTSALVGLHSRPRDVSPLVPIETLRGFPHLPNFCTP